MNRKIKRGGEHDVFYKEWALLHDHCQACGVDERMAVHLNGGVGLSTHHIIGGSGRSHEACNLLRFCLRCHDLAEDQERISEQGVVLARFTVEQCIGLKQLREPGDFDLKRLCELNGHPLEPSPPPEWLNREYYQRRPWEHPNATVPR